MADQDFRGASSFEDARASLGAMLGLAGPAPTEVTRRALVDTKYAMYLMMTRDSPSLRDKLLHHPENRLYQETSPEPAAAIAAPAGVAEVSAKAAGALAKWALAGFKTADSETAARRWQACEACENLVDPPPNLLYSTIKLIAGKDSKICAACGCVARKKVVLFTESCPVADPERPGLTRWGEPMPSSRRTAGSN